MAENIHQERVKYPYSATFFERPSDFRSWLNNEIYGFKHTFLMFFVSLNKSFLPY